MTSFVFDRSARYGYDEFLSNLDPDGYYNEEQYVMLRDLYVKKVAELIKGFDESLVWFPYCSEIWGTVEETKSDPAYFREWWEEHAERGTFADLLTDACLELDEKLNQ